MKLSNTILASTVAALILGSISYAFVIKNKATSFTIQPSQSLLEGKGSYFEDTIATEYSVLRSNFSIIFLDPRYEDTLIVDGYDNARDFIDYYVHGDTLEVFNSNLGSHNKVPDGKINSEYTLRVTVGAKNLKGLWLYGAGSVIHDARPTGARLDGTSVYSPSVIEKYKLQLGDFNITIRDRAKFDLFLSARRINLDYDYSGSSQTSASTVFSSAGNVTSYRSTLQFTGEAQSLLIDNPKGSVGIVAQSLTLDSLVVVENKFSLGSVRANPKKYLKAELHHSLDIFYDGSVAEKDIIETGYGRTINGNAAFFAVQENENRKRTEELVKTAQDIAAQVKDGSLRMLTLTELIESVRNNKGIFNANEHFVHKDQDGNVLTATEIKQAAIDSLGADYYADANGVIKEIVFRPRKPQDDILKKEIQSIRRKEVSIKNRFVNCNTISQSITTSMANDDIEEQLALVVNILRKCGLSSTGDVQEANQNILSILQQAPLQYRKEYQALITDHADDNLLSSKSLDDYKKGIEIDESIMKTYFEYPRRADQDNDQKIYEQILKINNDTQRETLGLEPLEKLLKRIGIKYQAEMS